LQNDGTWTDIPRCVEHEPGKDEQIPGLCPAITGYCSDAFLHQRCNYLCSTGKRIDSKCTQDGTWEPYPTCPGDLRETQDGCNPCPGPIGGQRNRTVDGLHSRPRAEIARRVKVQKQALENRFLGINSANKQTRPSNAINTGNRVVRPTFAGSLAFGAISSSSSKSQTNIPNRSNTQSFIPPQPKRQQFQPAPTPPAPVTRAPVSSFRRTTSRPSSRPQQFQNFPSQSQTSVIEPERTSPFLSIGPDGRIRSESDPNLSNTRGSGPAPNVPQQSMRQNQFSSGFSQQRNQNQQTRGRRPQSSFTAEQRKIIQEALAKLPKSVRQNNNFFNQQGMGSQQQQQSSQNQFGRFPQRQAPMTPTTPPRRLNFNPLQSQRTQMQQVQPQSRPTARPQPPTPPPRQSLPIQRQRQPQPQRQPRPQVNLQPRPQAQQTKPVSRPASVPRKSAPKKKLSALEQILKLQSKKGPTGAKNGGTPPPPTERPQPRQVMLFQEDSAVPRNGNNDNSFGVFSVLDLSSPAVDAPNSPQLRAFSAVPDTARSSRVQAANDRFQDNSQFGVFETVQL
jgi:hypothetical protein